MVLLHGASTLLYDEIRLTPEQLLKKQARMSPYEPRVSVLIVTYNHLHFVEAAIESARDQKCDFTFEILIADDGSADGTCLILERYRAANDPRLRFLLSEQNPGDYGNGLFIAALAQCRGEYVAWLDGDDYWTDEKKLQTMVSYLDGHPELSGAFHAAAIVSLPEARQRILRPPEIKSVYLFDDLVFSNIVLSSTTVYRMSGFPSLEPYRDILCLDWVLHLLQARRSGIGYVDEVMAAYRIHDQGVWSRLPPVRQQEEILAFVERIPELFDYDTPAYRRRLAREWSRLAFAEKSLHRDDQARMAAKKALLNDRGSLVNLLRLAAAFALPAPLLRLLRRIGGGVGRRLRRWKILSV
jgi:glycosyltransferase involved in cell wall biosynthesis